MVGEPDFRRGGTPRVLLHLGGDSSVSALPFGFSLPRVWCGVVWWACCAVRSSYTARPPPPVVAVTLSRE